VKIIIIRLVSNDTSERTAQGFGRAVCQLLYTNTLFFGRRSWTKKLPQKTVSRTFYYCENPMSKYGRKYNLSVGKRWRGCSIVRNSFHGTEIATLLDRCACAGVCAFVVVGVACTKHVSWAPLHMRVCTLQHVQYNRYLYKTLYQAIFSDTLSAGCAHALAYAHFVHWRLGMSVVRFN